jgi:hypothetical protein
MKQLKEWAQIPWLQRLSFQPTVPRPSGHLRSESSNKRGKMLLTGQTPKCFLSVNFLLFFPLIFTL